jgi:ribosomal protein L11 methyltransferase
MSGTPGAQPGFEEDVFSGPHELAGIWVRRPQDSPIRGALVLEQGKVFGSGTHPTTRLAARALALRMERPLTQLLDVGCGTGILSLLAARKGAGKVVAIDRNRDAAWRASQNARMNKLGVLCAAATPAAITARFDMVLANLWVDDLLATAASLSERVAPAGLLYVTGAPLPSAQRAVRELAKHRLRPLAMEADTGWAGILFLRS